MSDVTHCTFKLRDRFRAVQLEQNLGVDEQLSPLRAGIDLSNIFHKEAT